MSSGGVGGLDLNCPALHNHGTCAEDPPENTGSGVPEREIGGDGKIPEDGMVGVESHVGELLEGFEEAVEAGSQPAGECLEGLCFMRKEEIGVQKGLVDGGGEVVDGRLGFEELKTEVDCRGAVFLEVAAGESGSSDLVVVSAEEFEVVDAGSSDRKEGSDDQLTHRGGEPEVEFHNSSFLETVERSSILVTMSDLVDGGGQGLDCKLGIKELKTEVDSHGALLLGEAARESGSSDLVVVSAEDCEAVDAGSSDRKEGSDDQFTHTGSEPEVEFHNSSSLETVERSPILVTVSGLVDGGVQGLDGRLDLEELKTEVNSDGAVLLGEAARKSGSSDLVVVSAEECVVNTGNQPMISEDGSVGDRKEGLDDQLAHRGSELEVMFNNSIFLETVERSPILVTVSGLGDVGGQVVVDKLDLEELKTEVNSDGTVLLEVVTGESGSSDLVVVSAEECEVVDTGNQPMILEDGSVDDHKEGSDDQLAHRGSEPEVMFRDSNVLETVERSPILVTVSSLVDGGGQVVDGKLGLEELKTEVDSHGAVLLEVVTGENESSDMVVVSAEECEVVDTGSQPMILEDGSVDDHKEGLDDQLAPRGSEPEVMFHNSSFLETVERSPILVTVSSLVDGGGQVVDGKLGLEELKTEVNSHGAVLLEVVTGESESSDMVVVSAEVCEVVDTRNQPMISEDGSVDNHKEGSDDQLAHRGSEPEVIFHNSNFLETDEKSPILVTVSTEGFKPVEASSHAMEFQDGSCVDQKEGTKFGAEGMVIDDALIPTKEEDEVASLGAKVSEVNRGEKESTKLVVVSTAGFGPVKPSSHPTDLECEYDIVQSVGTDVDTNETVTVNDISVSSLVARSEELVAVSTEVFELVKAIGEAIDLADGSADVSVFGTELDEKGRVGIHDDNVSYCAGVGVKILELGRVEKEITELDSSTELFEPIQASSQVIDLADGSGDVQMRVTHADANGTIGISEDSARISSELFEPVKSSSQDKDLGDEFACVERRGTDLEAVIFELEREEKEGTETEVFELDNASTQDKDLGDGCGNDQSLGTVIEAVVGVGNNEDSIAIAVDTGGPEDDIQGDMHDARIQIVDDELGNGKREDNVKSFGDVCMEVDMKEKGITELVDAGGLDLGDRCAEDEERGADVGINGVARTDDSLAVLAGRVVGGEISEGSLILRGSVDAQLDLINGGQLCPGERESEVESHGRVLSKVGPREMERSDLVAVSAEEFEDNESNDQGVNSGDRSCGDQKQKIDVDADVLVIDGQIVPGERDTKLTSFNGDGFYVDQKGGTMAMDIEVSREDEHQSHGSNFLEVDSGERGSAEAMITTTEESSVISVVSEGPEDETLEESLILRKEQVDVQGDFVDGSSQVGHDELDDSELIRHGEVDMGEKESTKLVSSSAEECPVVVEARGQAMDTGDGSDSDKKPETDKDTDDVGNEDSVTVGVLEHLVDGCCQIVDSEEGPGGKENELESHDGKLLAVELGEKMKVMIAVSAEKFEAVEVSSQAMDLGDEASGDQTQGVDVNAKDTIGASDGSAAVSAGGRVSENERLEESSVFRIEPPVVVLQKLVYGCSLIADGELINGESLHVVESDGEKLLKVETEDEGSAELFAISAERVEAVEASSEAIDMKDGSDGDQKPRIDVDANLMFENNEGSVNETLEGTLSFGDELIEAQEYLVDRDDQVLNDIFGPGKEEGDVNHHSEISLEMDAGEIRSSELASVSVVASSQDMDLEDEYSSDKKHNSNIVAESVVRIDEDRVTVSVGGGGPEDELLEGSSNFVKENVEFGDETNRTGIAVEDLAQSINNADIGVETLVYAAQCQTEYGGGGSEDVKFGENQTDDEDVDTQPGLSETKLAHPDKIGSGEIEAAFGSAAGGRRGAAAAATARIQTPLPPPRGAFRPPPDWERRKTPVSQPELPPPVPNRGSGCSAPDSSPPNQTGPEVTRNTGHVNDTVNSEHVENRSSREGFNGDIMSESCVEADADQFVSHISCQGTEDPELEAAKKSDSEQVEIKYSGDGSQTIEKIVQIQKKRDPLNVDVNEGDPHEREGELVGDDGHSQSEVISQFLAGGESMDHQPLDETVVTDSLGTFRSTVHELMGGETVLPHYSAVDSNPVELLTDASSGENDQKSHNENDTVAGESVRKLDNKVEKVEVLVDNGLVKSLMPAELQNAGAHNNFNYQNQKEDSSPTIVSFREEEHAADPHLIGNFIEKELSIMEDSDSIFGISMPEGSAESDIPTVTMQLNESSVGYRDAQPPNAELEHGQSLQDGNCEHLKELDNQIEGCSDMSQLTSQQASYDLSFPEKKGFSTSDLVWGKVKSHPWWPGQIFDISGASKLALKYQKKDHLLVAYFGDKTFAWCEESRLKPFQINFSQMEKQTSSDTFSRALHDILVEISRRVELSMTCLCLPEETYADIEYQKVENAGVRGKTVNSVVDRYEVVNYFRPDKLLEYIRDLALLPTGGADRLELTVAQAQLKAFYLSKGYTELPSFTNGSGLLENDFEIPVCMSRSTKEDDLDHSATLQDLFSTKGKFGIRDGSLGKQKLIVKDGRKQKSLSELMEGKTYAIVNGNENASEVRDDERQLSSGNKRKSIGLFSMDTRIKMKKTDSQADNETTLSSPIFNRSFKVGEFISRAASKLTCGRPLRQCHGEKADDWTNDYMDIDDFLDVPFDSPKLQIDISEDYPPASDLLSKLCLAARNPLKGYNFSSIVISFFSAFRNLQVSNLVEMSKPEKPRAKRGRKKKVIPDLELSDTSTPDHMKDSYWSDMIVPEKGAMPNPPKRRGRKKKKFLEDTSLFQVLNSPSDCESKLHIGSGCPHGKHILMAERPIITVEEKIVDERMPTAVILYFNSSDSLPSDTDLIRIFSRYGPLKEEETSVETKTNSAMVVFKKRADAEMAFSSAGKIGTFGPALLSYRLRHFTSKSAPVNTVEGEDDPPPTTDGDSRILAELESASAASDRKVCENIPPVQSEDVDMESPYFNQPRMGTVNTLVETGGADEFSDPPRDGPVQTQTGNVQVETVGPSESTEKSSDFLLDKGKILQVSHEEIPSLVATGILESLPDQLERAAGISVECSVAVDVHTMDNSVTAQGEKSVESVPGEIATKGISDSTLAAA